MHPNATPRTRIVEAHDFDVVALVGSAGAMPAGLQLLRDLPAGLEVPVVVAFHLPLDSTLAELYARLPLQVEWAVAGARLEPGKVLVVPPRQFLELLPDGSCVLSPNEQGALDKPLDRFLASVARSFAGRAIGVVLSGMGDDAAAGALELHRAGGRVVVQGEASAEYPSMPAAAIAAGAADIVIPLAELGHLLGELLTRTPRPRMRSEVEAIRRVFGDQGELAMRAREVDWSQTPLGPAARWPEVLRVSARTVMDSPNPQAVWWGPELVQLYNDAWRHFLGPTRHPQALGGRARDSWAAIWHDIGPMLARVLDTGVAASGEDYPLLVPRHDFVEEVFADFSYSPIRDAAGAVAGVYNNVRETTGNVVSERRLHALRHLATQLAGAQGVRDACERAAAALGSDLRDVPFALFYGIDRAQAQATLLAVAGVAPGAPCAPHLLRLDADRPWPLAAAVADAGDEGGGLLLADLAERCPGLAPVPLARPGALPPQAALLRALRAAAGEPPLGVLVLGLSPHRRWDDAYRSFADLLVRQVAAGIVQGRAIERERERMERLAELDRAKTQFFANVSHEFRTPLTLLLAPLEELLRRKDELPAGMVADVDVAARNARRLQSLVTHLLDFSQMESRRQPARVVPLDLGGLTLDIVSHFRSAVEAAGLRLAVDVDVRLPPVPVDPEMWTTIVSNLLANALKFTFEGQITVTLNALRLHAELTVADTGIGIPEQEVPHIFKRFHRVRGARARTAEGAGIGLAMVQDLVGRMGGQVQVRSREGRGTSFVIWMPYKSHRTAAPGAAEAPPRPAGVAADLADQAARWVAGDDVPGGIVQDLAGPPSPAEMPEPPDGTGRLLVVDDNADMRGYLRRLLGAHWQVQAFGDGAAALAAARQQRPQAILTDVTMPGLDGFDLLRRVREDASLQHTPVVLVTARAGDTAAIEGLLAGADDYIAKPFSPRELVARVRAVIDRAAADRALQHTADALQASEERLARELADARTLQRVSTVLVSEQSPQALYEHMLDALVEVMRSDAASIQRLDPRTQELVLLAWRGFHPDSARFWGRVDTAFGSSCAVALGTGERHIVEDVDLDPTVAGSRAEFRRSGIRAIQSTPLVSRSGQAVGMVSTHWRQPHVPSADDLARLDVLARQVADLLERSTADQALRASEARQAYLVRLADALGPLQDPVALQEAAVRLLGEHLGVEPVPGEASGDLPGEPLGRSLMATLEAGDPARTWTAEEMALVQETAERTVVAIAQGRQRRRADEPGAVADRSRLD